MEETNSVKAFKYKLKDVVKETDNKYILTMRSVYLDKNLAELSNMYYKLLDNIKREKTNGDYNKVFELSMLCIPLLEPLIFYNKKEYGSFSILDIPPLEEALTYLPATGAVGQINNIRDLIVINKELKPWKENLDLAYEELKARDIVLKVLKEKGAFIQSELNNTSEIDVGGILYTMDRLNIVKREKSGRSYLVSLA